ncbi:MAG: hypothetical protein JWN46_3271, partial [Acidimicrobiales bacterium]|nr:hypothetical protein [Acidimicrobiales bacterium]
MRVVGGDGFLELRSTGHQVVVLDQIQDQAPAPRPYLQIEPDGTVQLNRSSIGYYINGSRYGAGSPPASIQGPGGATPRWVTVGHGGRYLWHDHRIHWMAPGKPPSVRGNSGKVDMGGPDGDWVVRLVVDGRPVAVVGELVLHAAPNPLPWLALALAIVVLIVAASQWSARWTTTIAAVVSGAVAVLVGWEQHVAVPAAAGGTPLSWALPGVALMAGMLAAGVRQPRRQATALLGASAALVGWVFMRWTVLTHAVLPTQVAAPV